MHPTIAYSSIFDDVKRRVDLRHPLSVPNLVPLNVERCKQKLLVFIQKGGRKAEKI